MTKTTDVREIGLDILMEVMERDGYSHLLLRQALEKYQYMDKRDRAFLTRLVEGTLEYTVQLDYLINAYSKVKVSKMKPVIRNLMRLSVYQILYMDSVPDSAACNEAVKLAGKRGFAGLKGFVNGLLRNIARNVDRLPWPEKEDLTRYLSVRYSMPEWIVEQWLGGYGREKAEIMLAASLKDEGTAVRCNLSRISRKDCIASLEAQGITVTPSPHLDSLLYLRGYDRMEEVEAFREGFIQPQDLGSALDVCLAAPKEDDYVIDVCAAPGGKSLEAADLMKGRGTVDARDLTPAKTELIRENARRCGFSNIRVKEWDALCLDEAVLEKADLVIADLPCSGLGVLGKKNDIKYKMSPGQQQELQKLQRRILDVVWRYVKPGGTLLYSTCTINPAENEENVRWFLETHPLFETVDVSGRIAGIEEASMKQGQLQLLPGVHPSDGFFVAVMKRKNHG